jgi:hypothetical protein
MEASEMRSSQGRFRADLEFVHDSDTAPTDSKVTIVDPRSGMRHTFTADEYMVCRAIDGTTTLAAARQAFKAETGREIAHSKLAAFFRRLRSLGLIEEDKSTVEIVPGSGEPDSTSMAEDGRRDVVTLERGRVDAVAKQPAMNTSGAGAAGIAQPTPPRAEGTAAASAGPELVTQSGPGAEPLLPAPSDPDAADFRNKLQARLQRAMHSGRRASNSRSPRGSANVAPASTAEAKKLDLPAAATPGKPDASQGFTEGSEELEFLGPEAGETESPAARPSDLRGKRRRAGRSKAGAARTARAAVRGPGDTGGPVGAGEQGDFDDLEAALDEMEPDGLRPMLGGGLGGYRLGGGNAQNLLAGLAARARARRGSESDEKEPARISLFNPNAILGVIAALSRPLKYLFVPLLLLAPTTVWIAYQYRNILAQDIRGFDESAVATVILGLVITVRYRPDVRTSTFFRRPGRDRDAWAARPTLGVRRIADRPHRAVLWRYAVVVRLAALVAVTGAFGISGWPNRPSYASALYIAVAPRKRLLLVGHVFRPPKTAFRYASRHTRRGVGGGGRRGASRHAHAG